MQRPLATSFGIAALLISLGAGCAEEGGAEIGASCSRDEQCASSRCDELLCKPQSAAAQGAPCEQPLDCLSEVCLYEEGSSRCGPGIRPAETSCSADEQCASGRCAGGVCVDAASDASPIEAGALDSSIADAGPPDAALFDLGSSDQGQDGALVVPGHAWSRLFGAAGGDDGIRIAINAMGQIFVIGVFSGSVDFGGGALTSAGGQDIFLASFDSGGQHLWSQRFGGGLDDMGHDVAVAPGGEIVITGFFRDTADFGGGALRSSGDADIFLARFDGSGGHLWSESIGGSSAESGRAVAVAPSGDVMLTGYFTRNVNFGSGPLSSDGSTDIFLASWDSAGQFLWAKRFGGAGLDSGVDIAVNPRGEVVLTGFFEESVDFTGVPINSVGGTDIFLAGFDTNGDHIWSKAFGNGLIDVVEGMAVHADGDIVIVGWLWGPATFGGGILPAVGQFDFFVARFDAAGRHDWSKVLGSAAADEAKDVAFDADGNVVVTGSFQQSADFGGGALSSAGADDLFIAGFDQGGQCSWSKRFGAGGSEQGHGIAVGADGSIVVTGVADSTTDLGGGALLGAGETDIFLLQLSP